MDTARGAAGVGEPFREIVDAEVIEEYRSRHGRSTERCQAYDGPASQPYGVCERPQGHAGRHQEYIDGVLWAEWSGPVDPWPGTPDYQGRHRRASQLG